jgi:molybdenum cofactor cytidylyltransferase
MGEPKQLLAIDGKPLIVRMAECLLSTNSWPVVVVLGANAELIRPALARYPVLVADNPAWAEGMASSLRTGIAALQQFSRSIDAALVTVCDQPALCPEVVRQLVAMQRATGRSMVAASYDGRNGVPALFLREHFHALTELTGEEGARLLLNRHPELVATVELPRLALDLDTPDDVATHLADPPPAGPPAS